jgi:hypothetical protein
MHKSTLNHHVLSKKLHDDRTSRKVSTQQPRPDRPTHRVTSPRSGKKES